jgi:acyl-coenzyme A thioesterase PaaI-like protein
MGRAIMVRHGELASGVTVEINVRFRRPVPLGVELTAVGRIVEETSRTYEGAGEIRLPDGAVAVEARARFVKLQMDRVGFDREREEWAVIPD